MQRISGWAGRVALIALVVAPGAANGAETQVTNPGASAPAVKRQMIERGRYLLAVGNCNDCHTAGHAKLDGKVAQKDRLLGSGPLGIRGPWGDDLRVKLARNC